MFKMQLDKVIPPIQFIIDNCRITIYEILKSTLISGETFYHVVLDIEYKGKRSRRYTLDAKSTVDFRKRLLVEISKFKWMVMLGEIR